MQQAQRVQTSDVSRCLIIEDSQFDSERMRRVLARSRYGFEAAVVTTLAAARHWLTRGGADLILLDNNLPDGLGTDFAAELAADPRWRTIPVLLISDWPSPFMWHKAATAGVRFVLSKREFDARFVNAALRDTPILRQNIR